MARYDYKCRECNTVEEVSHSINDRPTVVCSACGAERFKVLTAPALNFPGTGWGKDR